jgi:hypothetical protein
MTRFDDTGELLEGDGIEDTTLDEVGDNTGDAGDGYRASVRFGTTWAEQSRGQSLEQLLAEEEPDAADEGVSDSQSTEREAQRELAQLVTGGESSHSRTDPALVGPDRVDVGLSAEEAALHVTRLPDPPKTAD